MPPDALSRYGFLLLMPLRLAPLITLIVLSFVLTVALRVGVYGLPLVFILLSWLFKYSFVFLDRLVIGDVEPPVLSVEMVMTSLGEWRSLLPLILVIVLFFATGAAEFWVGAAAAVVIAVAAFVWLPAVLALQGWTGSVGQSMNPIACLRMARALGHDYVWIACCTLAVVAICVLLPRAIGGVPLVLRVALLIYAWLAFIALAGGALKSARSRLMPDTSFGVERQAVVSPEEIERERERWFDSIYGAWRSNAQENAWRTVMQRIDKDMDPPTEPTTDAMIELRWLYGRVAGWEQPQFANRVVREMLPRLLAADREGEALILVRERLAADPSFRPQDPVHLSRLARVAGEWGDRSTERALLLDKP
ncbi:MAG TPA: hypothetical protein VGO41_01955 [Steroidobacteraceae bacterium]|nr:hypothetical protein [Steroidobacteraceae bacterium]